MTSGPSDIKKGFNNIKRSTKFTKDAVKSIGTLSPAKVANNSYYATKNAGKGV